MNRIISATAILILLAAMGCNREENDITGAPSESSITLTGDVRTPEGKPFPDVAVNVDFVYNSMLGTLTRHKAKGKTDKNGRYRIFFEPTESDDVAQDPLASYTFSFDLSKIPADSHILPDDKKIDFQLSATGRKGKTINCDITVPRKKYVEVTIINNGVTVEEGNYDIRNIFSYGSGWADVTGLADMTSEMMAFEPVAIAESGRTSVMLPCAVGVTNSITPVYRGNAEVSYGWGRAVSDTVSIVPTDEPSAPVTFEYRRPERF